MRRTRSSENSFQLTAKPPGTTRHAPARSPPLSTHEPLSCRAGLGDQFPGRGGGAGNRCVREVTDRADPVAGDEDAFAIWYRQGYRPAKPLQSGVMLPVMELICLVMLSLFCLAA